MSERTDLPGKTVFRPAVFPENPGIFLLPLAAAGLISTAGLVLGNIPLVLVPLSFAAVFPGLPLAFHFVLYLAVRMEIRGDELLVRDLAGSPILRYPFFQRAALKDLRFIYYAEREINAVLGSEPISPFPCDGGPVRRERLLKTLRRGGSVWIAARSGSALVLSGPEGRWKVILGHFQDMAPADRETLLRSILEKAGDAMVRTDPDLPPALTGGSRKGRVPRVASSATTPETPPPARNEENR